jgi:phosphate transport system substrate-binding protein
MEYVSDAAIGEDGYLADKGLVTLPADKLEEVRAAVKEMKPMDGSVLK